LWERKLYSPLTKLSLIEGVKMSRKKRRTDESPMPVGSAGLLSFYQEKTDSIVKIRPEFVLIMTLSLILAVILASLFIPR